MMMTTRCYTQVISFVLNRSGVQNKEFGGEIYVYRRPNLREFLQKVRTLGDLTVYTQSRAVFADPIIDMLDPEKKIFKHRFYGENCIRNGEGGILKDMSVLERYVAGTEQR